VVYSSSGKNRIEYMTTTTETQSAGKPLNSGLLTKKQIAEALSVTERTISKWQNRSWLPFIKIGGRILYPWPEAREAIKRNFGHNCF
tara:strand:+ start:229 stop:489 length:261 start_codon:yes stop_codon:yes gene_type:complete